jgi:hypothetical protein
MVYVARYELHQDGESEGGHETGELGVYLVVHAAVVVSLASVSMQELAGHHC